MLTAHILKFSEKTANHFFKFLTNFPQNASKFLF
jgi:hypothetical protein